jgi:hypothetical protein
MENASDPFSPQGTPRDRLARWSYVTGYTLNGIEMVARSTGD